MAPIIFSTKTKMLYWVTMLPFTICSIQSLTTKFTNWTATFLQRKWHNVILIDRTLLRVSVKFTALDGLLWISLEPNSQFYWMSFATQRWNACMNKHTVSDHFTFSQSNWSRYLLLYLYVSWLYMMLSCIRHTTVNSLNKRWSLQYLATAFSSIQNFFA